ncbi:MAG: VanW family protein [Coriobacteriia bacterium]|nr:VanW family protein [Coriobacteriia bacterium]
MTDSPSISSVDYAQRRRDRALQRAAARQQKIPLAAIITGVVAVVLIVALEMGMSWGRVHPGVTVAGVPIGGMKPDAAGLTLEAALPKQVEKPVVVVYGDDSWDVPAEDIGLSFDYDRMVAQAMAVGREGGLFGLVGGRLSAWFGRRDLPALPVAEATRMGKVLAEIAKGTDVEPVDARVAITGTELAVKPSKAGRGLVHARTSAEILSAMVATDRQVAAVVETLPPAVSDADAKAALEVGKAMIAGPVTVTYKGKEWRFDEDEVAKWLAFRRSDTPLPDSEDTTQAAGSLTSSAPADVTLLAHISSEKAGKSVVPAVGAKIGRPAKSARFSTANGRVSIIPSQAGIGPDLQALASELTSELPMPASDRTFELRTATAQPRITTADAEAMGIKERISRYTTTYDGGHTARVSNIHLLGDALDGKLIAPGATFSFNGSVGERTAAKGYTEANAIVNGKLVPQLGGGICQVGTTLFNAAFESGLPIVQRQNHSFYISHYPDGRDATVSWGGPDIKFRNDTKHWVLVSVSYTGSSVTIALYGTDPGYDVEAQKGPWTNITPFPIEQVKDPTMLKGTKSVEDKGINGRRITVTRTVYKDGQVVREDQFRSHYKPKVEVVRVGTKPKPAESATPTGTPKP